MFENIRSDFQAHGRDVGAQIYLFGRWRCAIRPTPLRKLLLTLIQNPLKMVQIITGIELPSEAKVGRNFVIDHFGGIIVSRYAQFGDNCRVRNGVTVGLRRVGDNRAPSVGNNVDIGAGAKLLGAIAVGDNVVVGANAVVLCDVLANSIAVGVPAVVKARDHRSVPDEIALSQ